MADIPAIRAFPTDDLSLEAIDQNRARLQGLIAHCQRTIAEATRVLEQLDVERNRLAMLRAASDRELKSPPSGYVSDHLNGGNSG